MGRSTVDWMWFRQASESQQEVVLLLVAGFGLAIGAAVTAVLWRRRHGSPAWSLAAGCLAAELPMVHFGYCLGGLHGTLAGWAIGWMVASPFACLAAGTLYRARPRTATWGLTAIVLQLQVIAVIVGAWAVVAEGVGLLAAVWGFDYICRPGGIWDSRVEPWLERRAAYVAAGLVTLYPLFVVWILHSAPSYSAVFQRYLVDAFPVHDIDFAIQFTSMLTLVTWLINFARDLPGERRSALHAAVIPALVWFVVERSTPVTFADVSTFGVLFSLLFVLMSAATVRWDAAAR